MPVPTGRLAALVAVSALAVLLSPAPGSTFVVVELAVVVVAAVDWLLAVSPRSLAVERHLPGVVPLDGEAEVVWRVGHPSRPGGGRGGGDGRRRGRGRRRLRVALADELAPSLRATSRRARVVVPASGWSSAHTVVRPSRRGRFDVSEMVLRVSGPLGLVDRQGTRQVPAVLRVYPPFRSRKEAELRIDRARILEVGLRSAAGRGGGTEFESLRDYAVDDEFRRIDWSATARSGHPIVRTYRAERNQTVLLLLDAGRTMAGRVDDVPRLDHAMDAVMMLTAVATRLGDRAGLVAFDRRVRAVVAPGHAHDQLSRVTEAMYAIEPALAESDYRGAFAETLVRFRRRSLLVLFTELADQAVTETLLPALPLVSRTHLLVVASVADPDIASWAASVPTDAGTAYRKAAAVAARRERARTVARLRGMGATVVDAEPGRLAPLLADAYLKVKATGRL
jgi:uncharacterized protein (DUF58 family)